MDDSSDDDTITLKQQYGHISNEESLKIADKIDEDLLAFFIKEVVQEPETNVIPVERKGLNLFHPYLSNIEGLRFISIKPLNYHHSVDLKYKYYTGYHFGKSNILLTDAITTGSETRKILQRSAFKLKFLGGFKKVCGYLALKSALDELESEFPETSFKFLKIVENKEAYYEEHKKINYVYQKRMEPIDEEHKFIIAEIKPEFSLGEIKDRIIETIRKKYGDNFDILDNDLGIDSKYNFTIYFNDPYKILQSVLDIKLQDGDIIEKLAIRFKFSLPDSRLRFMVLSMPHLNKEFRLQHLKRVVSSSCSRNVPLRFCKMSVSLKILGMILGVVDRCALCAECFDTNISVLLMRDLYQSLSESGLLKVH